MKFMDTHCHLDSILSRLELDSFATLKQRHFPPEFAACITISCDPDSIEPTLKLQLEPEVYGSYGIHPHDARLYTPELEQRIGIALNHPKTVAYGEIGLDYHYEYSPKAVQRDVFIRQIEVGVSAQKPLIVHTREADQDTLNILRENLPKAWPVHVHCFTSTIGLAEQLLADFPNLKIGFTGIVTFKNSEAVRDVVRLVPVSRMLVETDGPYLAPVPFRGQIATPGHIPAIQVKLAEIKNMSVTELTQTLFENAKSFYGITINP